MYRRDVFVRQGGLDVGPGEDLEFSLRIPVAFCPMVGACVARAGRSQRLLPARVTAPDLGVTGAVNSHESAMR
jgi:hypothetical protein